MLKKGNEIPTIDVNLVTISLEGSENELGLDTANKIAVEPAIETTDAVKLIIKGVLRAQKQEQQTLTGNTITLTDNVFNPELVKILQGGQITYTNLYKATLDGEKVAGNYAINLNDGNYIVFTTDDVMESGASLEYNTRTNKLIYNGVKVLTYVKASTIGDAQEIPASKQELDEIAGYIPPVSGSSETGKKFVLNAYSAQYNAAGEIVNYERITYPNCTGQPVALSSEDGAFRAPEYTINSAPDKGQAPYEIVYVDELPECK